MISLEYWINQPWRQPPTLHFLPNKQIHFHIMLFYSLQIKASLIDAGICHTSRIHRTVHSPLTSRRRVERHHTTRSQQTRIRFKCGKFCVTWSMAANPLLLGGHREMESISPFLESGLALWPTKHSGSNTGWLLRLSLKRFIACNMPHGTHPLRTQPTLWPPSPG